MSEQMESQRSRNIDEQIDSICAASRREGLEPGQCFLFASQAAEVAQILHILKARVGITEDHVPGIHPHHSQQKTVTLKRWSG